MAQVVKLKRSSTAGNVPTTGQMVAGELAMNTADGKLFLRDDSVVRPIVTVDNEVTGSISLVNGTLSVEGSGSTLFEIIGSEGQLFSITDSLSGSLFAVSDVSGIPILEVFSDDTVKIGTFNNEAITVSGSHTTIGGVLAIPGFSDVSASLASAIAGGDDLGNHTATQNLDMGGFQITNVGNVDGVDVSALNSTVSTNTSNIATLTAATSSYLTTVDISDDTNLTAGTGITLTGDTLSTNDSQIIHDNLSGFVANEHIDHSTVSITAGSGLTGGGTIAATRTINVGAGDGISVAADSVAVDVTVLRTTGDSVVSSSAQIDHDSTTNFVANEHINHTSVSITAGNGLTGGGTIAATRTLNVGAGDGISVAADSVAVDATVLRTTGDGVVSSSAQINLGSATGTVDISSQTNLAVGNGITLTGDTLTVTAGTGLTQNAGGLSFDADGGTLTTNNADVDHILVNDGGTFKRITKGNINVGDFNNNVGYLTSVPAGTISSSAQITITESQISDLDHYTDSDVKTKLNTEAVVSGSAANVKSFLNISSADISDVDAFSQNGTYASLRAQGTTASDVGLGNVTNESKATMFTSPTFTGTPVAPTPSTADDSTKIATTAYVQANLDNLIGNAGAALDTLGELSASLADATGSIESLVTQIDGKLAKASNLSDLTNTATARTNLGVDPAGTDNSTNVTLVTTSHDYLSIAGQAITLGQIDISDDTNLVGGKNLSLLGDTMDLDDNISLISITASGNISSSGTSDNYFGGRIVLDNSKYIAGTETGGTTRNILSIDGSNITQVANGNLATNIKGTSITLANNTTIQGTLTIDGIANVSASIAAAGGGGGGGTVTEVTVGTGLDITNGTTTPNITLDLTEITLSNGLDSTATGLSLDLTEVIASDGNNLLLTSDGDGTLSAENITVGQGRMQFNAGDTSTGTFGMYTDLVNDVETATTIFTGDIADIGTAITTTAGYVCNLSGSWAEAQADDVATSTGLLGIATSGASSNRFLLRGYTTIIGTAFQGTFVAGQPIYINANSSGRYAFTPPTTAGHVSRVVGHTIEIVSISRVNYYKIYFNPSPDWIEL